MKRNGDTMWACLAVVLFVTVWLAMLVMAHSSSERCPFWRRSVPDDDDEEESETILEGMWAKRPAVLRQRTAVPKRPVGTPTTAVAAAKKAPEAKKAPTGLRRPAVVVRARPGKPSKQRVRTAVIRGAAAVTPPPPTMVPVQVQPAV